MIDILLGILTLFVLTHVPGPTKVGLLILLGLLFWINRRRKKIVKNTSWERTFVDPFVKKSKEENQDKDIITLSKDQYKVR